MAEFDRVFGDPPSSVQNPTAYREKGSKEVLVIIIPAGVRISQLIADLGGSLAERYLLILSNFYVRGLLHKKVQETEKSYLAGHHTLLRQLGGDQYRKLIQYGLDQHHIAKSGVGYLAGKYSYQYRINKDVLSLKKQQRYVLTNVWSQKARRAYLANQKQEFAERDAVHRKIADGIDGLTFDYSAAIQYVSTFPDDADTPRDDRGRSERDRLKAVIEHLQCDGQIWTTDKQGRNYTILVTIPKKIRQFFSYQKRPLWTIDISSSQPLLHLLLYPDANDEKKRYQAIVQGGEFWEFMNEEAGEPYDLSDPVEKETMKKAIYRQIFYSYREKASGATGQFATIFKRNFPILWKLIDAHKKDSGPKQSGPLAKAMQQTEAEAVMGAIETLKDKPYPLISIHDAIVTTEDGVEDVKTALLQSFSTADLKPMLAVKRLTFIPTELKKVAETTGGPLPVGSGGTPTVS